MITNTIKRIYLAKLVPAIIFIVFAGLFLYQYPIQEILLPNKLTNLQSLLSQQADQELVELTVPILYDTGYDEIRNSSSVGSYYYTFIGDTCVFFLLNHSSSQALPTTLENTTMKAKVIKSSEAVASLRNSFAKDLSWTETELANKSSDYLVSETDSFLFQDSILYALLFLFAIYAITCSVISILYLLMPSCSPYCRYLNTPRKEALLRADEALQTNRLFHTKATSITDDYLIDLGRFHVEAIPLACMIWVFSYSTISKINGISYLIVIHTTKGKVKLKQKQKFEADSIIEYLHQMNPNLLVGYSKENQKTAKSLAKTQRMTHINRLKEG